MNELWSEDEIKSARDLGVAKVALTVIAAFMLAIGIILVSIYGELGQTTRWIHRHMSMLVTVCGAGLALTMLPWYELHATIRAAMQVLVSLILVGFLYALFTSSEYIPLYR